MWKILQGPLRKRPDTALSFRLDLTRSPVKIPSVQNGLSRADETKRVPAPHLFLQGSVQDRGEIRLNWFLIEAAAHS